jgi:putative salt-induced outer membrane protein YdiY
VAMSDALGLRVGYLIRQNSDAPLGSKSTDTLTTLGISYKF